MILNEWTRYRDLMSKISRKAADEFRDFALKREGGIGSLDRQTVLEYAFALVQKYGQASGALACEMYEAIAEAQGVTIPPAQMADIPEFGEVAKAINGAIKQSVNYVPGVVDRFTKQVGQDTMLQNAKRDGAYFAWVSSGDTCAYCLMMSAIGWQKAGKKTISGNHAQHIHGNCDCQYIIDFKGDLEIKGYDPEGLRERIMSIVDSDEMEYWDFDDFLNRNARYAKGLKKRDREGLKALRNAQYKTGNMSTEEYARAKKLWYTVQEVDYISKQEKEHVYEELDNNLTAEEKGNAIVCREIGNFRYRAVNIGHNQYKIYSRELIDKPSDVVDEVLTELFGENWREYLNE